MSTPIVPDHLRIRPYPTGTTRIKKNRIKKLDLKGVKSAAAKARCLDPVYAAKFRKNFIESPKIGGRPAGLPDGFSEKQYAPIREAGLLKAKKVMIAMAATDPFMADNKVAHQAIETAVEILCLKGAHQLRLQAAKVLLDFTQRKPVTVSETTLKTAEAFLDDIVTNDASTASDTPPTV